jgi:hypothetical protein
VKALEDRREATAYPRNARIAWTKVLLVKSKVSMNSLRHTACCGLPAAQANVLQSVAPHQSQSVKSA